ncbi:MAG: hypothetical protein EOO47_18275 [Flavobacterium sp.]|nr:MAG: hypothetical protein EOO47_18275 [Flavobacterium sp.]
MQTEPQKPIYKPYTNQLAYNVMKALPDATVTISRDYITINVNESISDHKKWLYNLLPTLPDISHPIETVYFVIIAKEERSLPIIINPSEFNVMALQYAIDSGLRFSSPPDSHPFGTKPIPLDHPYYNGDNRYFHRKYERGKKMGK